MMDALTPDRSVTKADNRLPQKIGDKGEDSGRKGRNRDRAAEASALPKQSWRQYLRQRPWLVALAALGALAIIVGGILWWLEARQYETTDDAFIDARIVSISSQIAGAIGELDVTDNQLVKANDVIARQDDSIYRAQLGQAAAQVEQAQANITNLDAQLDAQHSRIDQANKQVTEAEAALAFSGSRNIPATPTC